jgi:hypothetical protein
MIGSGYIPAAYFPVPGLPLQEILNTNRQPLHPWAGDSVGSLSDPRASVPLRSLPGNPCQPQ